MRDIEKRLNSQSRAAEEALSFVLKEIFIENRPADRALAFYFKNHKYLGSRDRRLIYELLFSVFRWYGWLKKCVKINDLHEPQNKKEMLKILFLASMPILKENKGLIEHVDIWGKFLKINNKTSQFDTTFDLKRYKELLNEFTLDTKLEDSELLPSWVIDEFEPNIDIVKFLDWNQKRPPIWIRVNKHADKIVDEFAKNSILFEFHPLIKNAISIKESHISLYLLDSFKAGLFEIQDLASQCIGLACSPNSSQRWWDACAGAGGKTLQLSSLMNNKGKILSTDIREYKLDDLKRRAKRAQLSNIQCSEWNGKSLRPKKSHTFDGVLVDAPCSCSGTWRRNPDAKWRLSKQEVDDIVEIQKNILKHAESGVKKNGLLIYATCSVFKRENREVVDNFLAEHNDYRLEPFKNPITGMECSGMLQIMSWDGNSDSMFMAKLRKIN